jgi:ribosomal protein L37AE/L43A
MLLKNGKPFLDVFVWECDGCGKQTSGAALPEHAFYRGTVHCQPYHFQVVVKAKASVVVDLCHDCANEFKHDAPEAETMAEKVLKRRAESATQ